MVLLTGSYVGMYVGMHVHILILTVFALATGLAPALHAPPHAYDVVAAALGAIADCSWFRRRAGGGACLSALPPVDESLLFRLPGVPPPQVGACQVFAFHEDVPAAALPAVPHHDEPAALLPHDDGGFAAAAAPHQEDDADPHGLFQLLTGG